MNFFEKLEKVREKPVAAKKRILALVLFFSMALVIGFWLSLFKFGGFSSAKTQNPGPRPWEVVKETFKSSKEELKKVLPQEAEIYLSQ